MKQQAGEKMKSVPIKSFWYKANNNIGDSLTPILIWHLLKRKAIWVQRNHSPKLLACGSIMKALRNGDTVWGAGIMRNYDKFKDISKCKFLAVRGKLTESILGINCGVYGDPALLLPLIYNPKIEIKHRIGIVEHYVDAGLYKGEGQRINPLQNWNTFINELKQCEKIISSSLHGCIIAEAYGIETECIKLSDKVLGGGFKFKDYLSASNRTSFEQPFDLQSMQTKLASALRKHYL